MAFKPKITIRGGHIPGYGGPDLYWTKGVYDNRLLYYIEARYDGSGVAVRGERERVKWEKSWPSKEAFLRVISKKPLDAPLCSNCGQPSEGGSNCLEKRWCDAPACREALASEIEEYKARETQRRLDQDAAQERQKQRRIAALDKATKCFHFRDGWHFRRLDDGSVRVMHRENPRSEYLRADVVIDAMSWASIVCSVSREGETGERWNQAQDFHGRLVELEDISRKSTKRLNHVDDN